MLQSRTGAGDRFEQARVPLETMGFACGVMGPAPEGAPTEAATHDDGGRFQSLEIDALACSSCSATPMYMAWLSGPSECHHDAHTTGNTSHGHGLGHSVVTQGGPSANGVQRGGKRICFYLLDTHCVRAEIANESDSGGEARATS
jgi:hypothetical protein